MSKILREIYYQSKSTADSLTNLNFLWNKHYFLILADTILLSCYVRNDIFIILQIIAEAFGIFSQIS